jgi:hypothetical protein
MENDTPQTQSWRELMLPEELAAFDKGETLPAESRRISRDKRDVHFNPEYAQHQPSHAPELAHYYEECLNAIDGLAGLPTQCTVCGTGLEGDTKVNRATMVIHRDEENRAIPYCWNCFEQGNLPSGLPTYIVRRLSRSRCHDCSPRPRKNALDAHKHWGKHNFWSKSTHM